jgi:hypothetical protein
VALTRVVDASAALSSRSEAAASRAWALSQLVQAWTQLGDSDRAGLAARRAAKAEAQLARLIEAGGEESGGEDDMAVGWRSAACCVA